MSEADREFLNALVLRFAPKKVLELGVCAGGSSLVILNALKHSSNAKLYAVDYLKDAPKAGKNMKVGELVETHGKDMKDNYRLWTGGLAMKFMDEIGGDIDFCLIDTPHVNPGEILDFLMVLPYLKDNAVVVFHDVNLHTKQPIQEASMRRWNITNNMMMSAIRGKKMIMGNFDPTREKPCFPNIGAMILDKSAKEHIWEIFNLLTIRWVYRPTNAEQKELVEYFARFYPEYFIKYLEKVFAYHNKAFDYEENRPLKKLAKSVLPKTLISKLRRFIVR